MQPQEKPQIIEQVIAPPLSTSAGEAAEYRLLQDNLDLMLKHAAHIIETPALFYAAFSFAYIAGAFVGDRRAGIGQLLTLWRRGELVSRCPACGGIFYLFSIGGSPLSGMNSGMGICAECKGIEKTSLSSFGLAMPALKYLKSSANVRKVRRTRGQSFAWSSGLVGEAVPDEILEEGVTPVTIDTLVARLQQLEGQA